MSTPTTETRMVHDLASAPRSLPEALRPVALPPALGAAPSDSLSLERLQSLGSRALAEAGYRVRQLGTAALAGIAALVAAVTVFIASNIPQSAAVASLQGELAQSASLSKVVTAAPAGAMLASLPPRAAAPDVVARIYAEAKGAGVELPRGQYEYVPARDGVAARYRMTFPVHAAYPQLRAFMDRTLLALPAVAVEGLRIERKSVGDGSVDAELKLAAFVRSDP